MLILEEMKLDNNVLYIMAQNNYGEVTRQIVMPNSYKHQVAAPLNKLTGHMNGKK